MATDFTMTARDMVTQAMREINVIAAGENPSSEEMQDGIVRLNSMLKSWASKGLNLWRDTEGSAVFPAGTRSQALPGALSISSASIVINPTNERPLAQWETDQYEVLPNKAAAGEPVAYSLVQSTTGITMRLWPVPTRDTTVTFNYARITADVVNASDPVDVPQMFQETVWKNLALKLASTFGKVRADPQTVAAVAADAGQLMNDMLDYDRPSSYMLGTDLDGYP